MKEVYFIAYLQVKGLYYDIFMTMWKLILKILSHVSHGKSSAKSKATGLVLNLIQNTSSVLMDWWRVLGV